MASKLYNASIFRKAFGRHRSKGSVRTVPNDSHLPLLPVELWRVILVYALETFFSLDPTADYVDHPAGVNDWLRVRGRGDEEFQIRVVLRQVCRTWRQYVDLPDIKRRFTFARLGDINQSSLSDTERSAMMAELPRARRIEGRIRPYTPGSEVISQLHKTIGSGSTFDAEILTNVEFDLGDFVVCSNLFPRLKALTINACDYPPDGGIPIDT